MKQKLSIFNFGLGIYLLLTAAPAWCQTPLQTGSERGLVSGEEKGSGEKPSPTPERHFAHSGEPHASLLKSGNPPTQLAPQRSGSSRLPTNEGRRKTVSVASPRTHPRGDARGERATVGRRKKTTNYRLTTINYQLSTINATPDSLAQELDLSPEVIQESPVLQRWRQRVPDVLEDIQNDPSFRTLVRLGYSQFPSTGLGGVNVGVKDVFIRSRFTVSGEYQGTFDGKHQAYGADLHFYLRPLGSYVNVATVVGYRHLQTNSYSTDGVNLGAKLLLVLSRGGAADISLTQSWVAAGTDEEVGLTTLSAGYALTRNLRLSTDIQKQNARQNKDSRVGVVLEWMP